MKAQRNNLWSPARRMLAAGACLWLAAGMLAGTAQAYSPTNVTGLTIWVDASDVNNTGSNPANGAGVATWVNKAGAFNATQGNSSLRPTMASGVLNGLDVVRFTRPTVSTARYLEFNNAAVLTLLNKTNTAIVVARANNGGGDDSSQKSMYLFARPGYHSGMFFNGYPSATAAGTTRWLGSKSANIGQSLPYTQGQFEVITRTVRGTTTAAPSTLQLFLVHTNQPATTNVTYALWNHDNQTILRLGCANTSGLYTGGLDGDIAEMLFYNRELSTAERQELEGYLAWKWGMEGSLPSDHPHKLAAPGATLDAPIIQNEPVSEITDASATLNGWLVSTGTSATAVGVYWGPEDGEAAGTWFNTNWWEAGVWGTNTYPSLNVVGLAQNTTYYYTYSATNASATRVAAPVISFKTHGAPAADNGSGATTVGASMAILSGTLTDGAPAYVFFDVWIDGAGVTNRTALGEPRELGGFSASVGGLTPDTNYLYKAFVSNAYGMAWAETATSFTTLSTVVTNGNVTWLGGAGSGLPYWDIPTNWLGGAAPAAVTAGIIQYGANGMAVTGKLETDRTVGGLTSTHTHRLDLNGQRLTLNGAWSQPSGNQTFTVTNGVLQIGTPEALKNIDLGQVNGSSVPTLRLSPGLTLHPYIDKLRMGCGSGTGHARPGARLDLRGVQLGAEFGGVLRMNEFNLRAGDGGVCELYMDNATGITTIEVLNFFGLAYDGRDTYARIGNPNDGWRLPPGLNVRLGDEAGGRRANAYVGFGSVFGVNTGELILNGGDFVAWLTDLHVGRGTSIRSVLGILDLRKIMTLAIDAPTLTVGTTSGGSRNGQGRLWLGGGSVNAGSVAFGNRPYHVTTYPYTDTGWANVLVSNTTFTVTNSLWVGKNATLVIDVLGASSGIDVTKVDAFTWTHGVGSSLRVNFRAAPDAEPFLHALRLKGNHMALLADMAAAGELTHSIDAGITGMKAGAFYSNAVDTTYYALVDAAQELPPVFSVRDATFEVESGGTVSVAASELFVSAYDFESRPYSVTLTYGDQVKVTELALSALGDNAVTVTMTIDDNGTPIDYELTSTVTLAAIAEATDSQDVTWSGEAKTTSMNRPEWFWGGNWNGGVPPAVITTGRIVYNDAGQSVTGVLETDRTVGGIYALGIASTYHTLDLGGNRLTVKGNWEQPRLTQAFTVTNGVLQLGAPDLLANINVGRLGDGAGQPVFKISPDVTLHPYIDKIRVGYEIGYTAAHPGGLIDLRGVKLGAEFAGVLRVNEFSVRSGAGGGVGEVYLDNETGITSLEVLDLFGVGLDGRDTASRIGNPNDGWRLPSGMNVRLGDAAMDRRASASIGIGSSHSVNTGELTLNGGDFVAWVTTLHVGRATSLNSAVGILDLRSAADLSVDAQTVTVGTSVSGGAGIGNLWFGPGTVLAGSVTVGDAVNTNGYGLLTLSNTVMTVTNTLTVASNGTLSVTMDNASGGLHLPADATLSVSGNGKLVFSFAALPAKRPDYYGLSWVGDHTAELALLASQTPAQLQLNDGAEIYLRRGVTYIGVPQPPTGTLIILR